MCCLSPIVSVSSVPPGRDVWCVQRMSPCLFLVLHVWTRGECGSDFEPCPTAGGSPSARRRGDWSGRFAIGPVGAHRHTPPGPTVCHTAGVCCGYPSGHLWSVAWGWWCVRQVSCGVHGGVFRFAGKPSSTHLSTDAGCGGFACRTRRRRQARGVRLGVVCRSWLSDEAGALACRQAHGTQSTASHLPPDPLT